MELLKYWALILIVGTLTCLVYYLINREKILRRRKIFVAKGVFVQVIHKGASFSISSGFWGKDLITIPMLFSTIFFDDGRTAVVYNVTEFPPLGSYIEIYRNRLPEFWIEVQDIPPSSCI